MKPNDLWQIVGIVKMTLNSIFNIERKSSRVLTSVVGQPVLSGVPGRVNGPGHRRIAGDRKRFWSGAREEAGRAQSTPGADEGTQ
jgi:hypothetical protein